MNKAMVPDPDADVRLRQVRAWLATYAHVERNLRALVPAHLMPAGIDDALTGMHEVIATLGELTDAAERAHLGIEEPLPVLRVVPDTAPSLA